MLAILVAFAAGCGTAADAGPRGGGGPGKGPPGAGPGKRDMRFAVEVRPVESRQVEYTVAAVGSVEAFEIVQVTSRVAGVVEHVRFAEGDLVEPSTVLVSIEPRRFRLAVEAARAALAQAAASEAEATQGLGRRERVNRESPGLVRGEELEGYRTRAGVAAAAAAQARVALERARLDASDAQVRAPVGGLIQTRTVQTGQYVQPGTVLATLVRRDPLLLRFTVPETDARRLSPGLVANFRLGGGPAAYRAVISHVAGSADAESRMVAVTARVEAAEDPALRPGAFAEVSVPVGSRVDAPVIPQTAVRPSERGFLAFVVQDGVAHERVLEIGLRTPEGLVEVRSGLRPGEPLVVRGAEALRDGAEVRVAGAAPGPGGGGPGKAPGSHP